MVQLVGIRAGTDFTRSLQVGGTITTGGTAQLILPARTDRTYLLFQNTSDIEMRVGLGGARATAAVSGGVVTTVTVTNSGFGYTKRPEIIFVGGVGGGIGFPSPPRQASAIATVTSTEIASIAVSDGGSGYTAAPFVIIINNPEDYGGAFKPSATAGYQILPGGSMVFEASTVVSDALTVYGATTGKTFECMVV